MKNEEKKKRLETLYAWSQLYRNSLYQTRLTPSQFKDINNRRSELGLPRLLFPIINNRKYSDQGKLFREDGKSFDEHTQDQISKLKKELGIYEKTRKQRGQVSEAKTPSRREAKR